MRVLAVPVVLVALAASSSATFDAGRVRVYDLETNRITTVAR
jgi:hypothetical protein